MTTTTETLLVHSVEGFLTATECATICDVVDASLVELGRSTFAEERTTSVHAVDGMSTAEVMRHYEPSGRLELHPLPEKAQTVVDTAAERAMPHLASLFPSARRIGSWIYLEYQPGQFITPHIDLPFDDTDPTHIKVSAIGVTLNDDYAGGEFFVESCGSPRLWRQESANGLRLARHGSDMTAEWYRALPRTRWRVRPRAGDAVLWGSQLSHGTEAVSRGRVKKVIAFVTN
jgi:predicted 2-oxoglutarate/Fe(II)-dependent dioxygenase YbiX